MERTKGTKALRVKIGVIVAVCISLAIVSFILLSQWEELSGMFPEQTEGDMSLEHNGIKYVHKDNIETFLVIGLDKLGAPSSSGDSYKNDMQADFLMLFVFDNDTKQCTAIHINRDTMAPVNILGVAGNKVDTAVMQIALSHTYGNGRDLSCHNTADAVSSVLMGIKINHYVSVTMDSVAVLNDLVGGVEVVVLDDFTSVDETLVKGATVTLAGNQALTYIRERKNLDDSSNVSRMIRQRQYIAALNDAFEKCAEQNDQFTLEAITKLSDSIVSDRSVNQLEILAEKFRDYEFLGIKTIEGETQKGAQYVEFYPNEASLKELIISIFYKPKE